MTYTNDVFNWILTKDYCEVCSGKEHELMSFTWGRVNITACEKCFKDIKNRIAFGLKKQHPDFQDSESSVQNRSNL